MTTWKPGTTGRSIFLTIIIVLSMLSMAAPAAGAASTSVRLSPGQATANVTETTTFDIVVENADGGVGAYSATVSLGNATVANITGVKVHGDPDSFFTTVNISTDNSSVSIETATMDTNDTGAVVIGTVTVEAESNGTTAVGLSVSALGTEGGSDYSVTGTNDASLFVGNVTAPADNTPPTVFNASAIDRTDGDGNVSDGDLVEIRVNATDAGSGIAEVSAFTHRLGGPVLRLTPVAGEPFTHNATFQVDGQNASLNGEYDIQVDAVDTAGNSNSTRTNFITLNLSGNSFTVHSKSVTHISGTQPSAKPNLDISFDFGLVQVQLRNESNFDPYELGSLGADRTTTWQLQFTFSGTTPRVILGSAHNLTWTKTRNANGSWTVSINASPAEVQSKFPTPDQWTGDIQASQMQNHTVSLAISPLQGTSAERQEDLNGSIWATDAQSFSSPRFDEQTNTVSVSVEAPHFTVNHENNTGFFEAFLTADLLASWGVSNASQLQVTALGSSVNPRVVANTSEGIRLFFPVNYSAGTVAISPSQTTQTSNASVTLSDQTSDGEEVTVDSVSLPEGGFIAIHNGSSPSDKVIGNSTYLTAGQHQDVPVLLDSSLDAGTGHVLTATIHKDSDGDQQFGFGQGEDPPYVQNGRPVSDSATISVTTTDGGADLNLTPFGQTSAITRQQTNDPRLSGKFFVDSQFASNVQVTVLRSSPTNYTIDITAPDNAKNVTFYLQTVALSAAMDIQDLQMFLEGEEQRFMINQDAGPGPMLGFKVPSFSTKTVTFKSSNLTVTDVSLNRSSIQTGQALNVTATVENSGSSQETDNVSLIIDNQIIENKSITVPAGGTATKSFNHTFGAEGEFEVVVNDVAAPENVTVDDTAPTITSATITDDNRDGEVQDGESVNVTVEASDAGAGIAQVTADASAFGAGEVTLSEDSSGNFTGTFTVNIDGASTGLQSVGITVQDAAGNSVTNTTDKLDVVESTSVDGGQPGFGIVVALVALLVVVIAARVRRP